MNTFQSNQLYNTTVTSSGFLSSLKEILNRPISYPVAFGTNYVVRTPMLFTSIPTTTTKSTQVSGTTHFMIGNK